MTQNDLIKMAVEADNRSKSNTHRIDRMEERQDNLDRLVATVAVIAEKQGNMDNDVKDIKSSIKSVEAAVVKTQTLEGDVATIQDDVEVLKNKPAKRWEAVVEKIIMLIVGGVVAFLLTKLGLN